MANSSVGSDIFALVSLLVIALLVLLVIRHYLPLRTTPGYLLVPVFLALALPSSIILLVPIDLASADGAAAASRSHAVWLPPRVILVTWRITYWLTFCLTWFILPFLGEFCDSGYRDARSRTLYSLRTNARYQLIVVATGIAGLVYFIWENGFHGETIKSLIMALAYAWGLFLAIGLMGHGLVAMPRRLFKSASVGQRLRRLYTQAPTTKEKMDVASEALEQLEQTVVQLKRHKGGASREQQEWIDELAESSVVPLSRYGVDANSFGAAPSVPAVVTDRYLADLTRKVKRARHRKARFVEEWSRICQQAQAAQCILDSKSSKKLQFTGARQWAFVTPSMRYQLHMNLIPAARLLFSAVLAVASLLIIWSELINPIQPKLSVVGLSVVHQPGDRINFGGQLIAAAWLLYMDAAALYAMADVKVWGNRALVTRQTYAESACWYSLQVAKLTVPLSYNFITMLPERVFQGAGFYRFLGKLIDLTPLGERFSAIFPCVLLLPALATLFNLYGRAKGVLGFGGFIEDGDEDGADDSLSAGLGGWRDGRRLVEAELQSRGSGAASAVGLTTRGESLDLERGLLVRGNGGSSSSGGAGGISTASAGPYSDTPSRAQHDTRSTRLATDDARVRTANRQFNAITNRANNSGSNEHDNDDDDDSPRHFYQDIAERMRNTFDTAERPQWVRNLSGGFKKPKWMQNEQQTGGDNNGGSPFSRLFRGRNDEGRVRL